MNEEEAVFKEITKSNWADLAEFLGFNRGAMRTHIGYFIWWHGVPGESDWSFSPVIPEIHVTITDSYISDRLKVNKKKPLNPRKKK